MPTTKEQLIDFLRDREFRGYFTEDQAYELLAIQIRQLRDKYGWTQAELGEKTGMMQEAISRAENPNYRGTKISTLAKLANAFDVALMVRLAPFSEFANWVARLSEASFEPPSFDEETLYAQASPNPAMAFAEWISAMDKPLSTIDADPYNVVVLDTYRRHLMTDECLPVGPSPKIERRYRDATA